MRIKDIMTRDVVTIPSTTPIIEAERILAARGIERLPVVDMGRTRRAGHQGQHSEGRSFRRNDAEPG